MTTPSWRRRTANAVFLALLSLTPGAAVALQVHPTASRFDALAVADPGISLTVTTTALGLLPADHGARLGWGGFRAAHGDAWSIYIDRRSGAPLLVEGSGIPWSVGEHATVESLAKSLREFIAANRPLLGAEDKELVLDRDGSGELLPNVWQVVFDRMVAGVPVTGERYLFTIGHGMLISFGTPRWSRIDASPIPELDAAEAGELVSSYMKLTGAEAAGAFGKPRLEFLPLLAKGTESSYGGEVGGGYTSALVWRLAAQIEGESGTWEALVDAHTGVIRSFRDVNDYAHAKGGVYPLSDDQNCPEGCENPNYPMPFARIYIGNTTQMTDTNGAFSCTSAGASAGTVLNGRFFTVMDACGLVSQSTTCDSDLDLRTSTGTNCTVPPGSSLGNTHAERTTFYQLNRIAEHARSWLPSILWTSALVEANVNAVNEDGTNCNAFYETMGGTLNFLRTGPGCRNSGELAGVNFHEWGHGLDYNDGGGRDSPSEAYGDITSFVATHVSCLGRGFHLAGNCVGYGNACLSCTGIRDLDWDKRADHAPSTPSSFLSHCGPFGLGPCGKEEHCEGYIAGETFWDLATRDLTASGLDQASAWQLTDRLWFQSRLGSGGPAYNCSLPSSDGCAATSWFSKLRAVDDDDGNLANGTPHAAEIFAAFNRHAIACGAAGDASNQNSTGCSGVGSTTLTASIANGSTSLSWSPVANAVSYRVLKNELGCSAGSTAVATVFGTSFDDLGLVNGLTEYYRVQPLGLNAQCEGPVSNCQAATPQPFAGTIKLNATSYGCAGLIGVTVNDANIGAGTTSVRVASATEPAGETITLTRVTPGSDTYTGTIALTSSPPAPNGVLSVVEGDTITATYVDASDGGGGLNVPRLASAFADCVSPVISKVQATNITGTAAKITWTTDELANTVAHYGTAPPPAFVTSAAAAVTGHAVDLSGLTECTPYVYGVDSTDVVGNLATDTASGAYYAFQTGKSQVVPYASTDTPIPIPDLSPAGATSTIAVADSGTVQDVDVTINIQHTFDGDLTLRLTTPDGIPILLADPHGGREDNYTNTVFDDEAAAPLGESAPFTGTFRPDSPLHVADGINATGAWKFTATDRTGQDVGAILDWTLQLTFATPACGAHASLRSQARVADACATGGSGGGNASWDAGEHVRFKLVLANDGTTALTGVTATVASTTPGVVLTDGTAGFPDIPPGGTAESLSPHFAAYLPTTLVCGGSVQFQVAFACDQGAWGGAFEQFVGAATDGTGRIVDESFASGIPATWSVLDGGVGGGAASTWTAANPGVRTIGSPMRVPVATMDSDAAGPGATQDESLLTPILNLSAATAATLQFDQCFRWFAGGLDEIADVDVRSSLTGGAWVNVLRQQGAASADPDHETVDITAEAAGAADAQVRFHDWNGSNEQYWQIDNVTIDTSAPGACDMPSCALPVPSGAKPVADGLFGAPMTGSRGNPSGTTIQLTWDITTCASADHHVLYGDLADVSSMAVMGAACDLGTSGAASWTAVPAGDLWFVVVGDDNATTEGTWGVDGIGGQRGGTTASGQCEIATRNNGGICP